MTSEKSAASQNLLSTVPKPTGPGLSRGTHSESGDDIPNSESGDDIPKPHGGHAAPNTAFGLNSDPHGAGATPTVLGADLTNAPNGKHWYGSAVTEHEKMWEAGEKEWAEGAALKISYMKTVSEKGPPRTGVAFTRASCTEVLRLL